MTNVTRLHHALPLPPDVVAAINDLDASFIKAIDESKAAGLQQGMIDALWQGQVQSVPDDPGVPKAGSLQRFLIAHSAAAASRE